MSIRNAAKAILIHDQKILLNKNRCTRDGMYYGLQSGAIYYDFPGGGQNQYETLHEAVIRECAEESGYTVAIDWLAAVFEEILMNEQFRHAFKNYAHKIYFLFLCHLKDTRRNAMTEKDFDMLESEWIDLKDIKDVPLYPRVIHSNLNRILQSDSVVYLGSERVC